MLITVTLWRSSLLGRGYFLAGLPRVPRQPGASEAPASAVESLRRTALSARLLTRTR